LGAALQADGRRNAGTGRKLFGSHSIARTAYEHYVEGQNLTYVYLRTDDSPDQLDAAAMALAQLPVSIIRLAFRDRLGYQSKLASEACFNPAR